MDSTIQWFPGHMVKAKRLVRENLKLVDVVVELLDARIPISSRNPDLQEIIEEKPKVVALNKADLAEDRRTELWIKDFAAQGIKTAEINSTSGQGIDRLISHCRVQGQSMLEKLAAKGRRPRPIRIMILGIPNVGKSSLINKLAGRGTARTGDKPGVTRGKQWIRVGKDMELLDTPGILWPKFEDPEVGFNLAVTGAIKEEIINVEQVVTKLLKLMVERYPDRLINRYKLEALNEDPVIVLNSIGQRRGLLVSGGQVDSEKAAYVVLSEFRTGKLGRFTLELPESYDVSKDS